MGAASPRRPDPPPAAAAGHAPHGVRRPGAAADAPDAVRRVAATADAAHALRPAAATAHAADAGALDRAAFAQLLASAGSAPAGTPGPPFADVAPSAPYARAVEAVTGLGWMSGATPTRFDPGGPMTRVTAAEVAVDFLGLQHVAADEARLPLPYADAGAIPAYTRGAVAVAWHLGLLPPVGDRFAPREPLDRAAAAAFLRRLTAVTPTQVQAEGARVAAYVHVVPAAGTVEAGGRMQVRAYAHDAAGYIVPARFRWRSSTHSLYPEDSGETEGRALLRAGGPGSVTLRATVIGSAVTGTAVVQVQRAVSLAVAALPPAVLDDQALALPVRILTASGQTDTGADFPVRAVATAAVRGTRAASVTTTAQAGSATLWLPPLPAGRYAVRVSVPGHPELGSVGHSLVSVAAPVGVIRLRARSGGTSLQAGATLTVDGDVYLYAEAPSPLGGGDTWPIQVSVSGSGATLPYLVGESPPPAALQLRVGSSTLPAASGPVAVVAGAAPGVGFVSASVPGGALTAGALQVQVSPAGRFGDAAVRPAHVRAGDPAVIRARLLRPDGSPAGRAADTAEVFVEPVDPAGHPRPYLQATVTDGVAAVDYAPIEAGSWTFRWRAPGYVPLAAGRLVVEPGPPVALFADATPTSVVLPGQRVAVQAWLADRYGNAVQAPFALSGGPVGPAAAGRLDFRPGRFPGPGTVGAFIAAPATRAAGASGGSSGAAGATEVLAFWSPDHPRVGTARLVLRRVPDRAARVAGKGLWLVFGDWRDIPDATLLQDAQAEGVTHIYLEVATTLDGFYGGRALDDFVAEAHAAGIALVAWVYAGLEDPAWDTALVRQVARYVTPHGDRPDGVALDVEEVMTPSVVGAYTAAADAAEGPSGLVVGVTYPPQYRMAYPFAAMAEHVQVFAPMDYWHVFESDYNYATVYRWVGSSVALVRRLSRRPGVPIEVIAQTFDEFSDGGTGIFSPTSAELSAAVRAAGAAGAIGVSFYRPTTATAAELAVVRQTPWPPVP